MILIELDVRKSRFLSKLGTSCAYVNTSCSTLVNPLVLSSNIKEKYNSLHFLTWFYNVWMYVMKSSF